MQVDRRTFLVVAGAAIASTPGFAKSMPDQPVPKRRIKKAVKFGMIGAGATLQEKFTILRDCGFDGVEMDSPNDLDPDEVLKARDASGLTIPGVVDSAHWRDTLSHPEAAVRDKGRAALDTAIRDCKTYGGTSVLLVPAVVKKDVSYADAWQRSQDEIRKVLPLCRELDIRIAIENVWNNFLLSPLEAARYTDEIDPQWVGWHFDIGNIVNYGWPEHWIRTLGKRVWKLDIKEFSRKKRDDEGLWKGFDVELMEGDCGWPEVMKALDEIGYEGWAAAEVAGGDAVRLKFLAERMDKIFAL
jgi:L-ribulose-5-phosphate 3-epimerase